MTNVMFDGAGGRPDAKRKAPVAACPPWAGRPDFNQKSISSFDQLLCF